MRFVRKPKPYTAGLGARRTWPAGPRQYWPPLKARRLPRLTQPAAPRRLERAVTGLAAVGALVCLLTGGFALSNQLGKDAQFQRAAQHLALLGAP